MKRDLDQFITPLQSNNAIDSLNKYPDHHFDNTKTMASTPGFKTWFNNLNVQNLTYSHTDFDLGNHGYLFRLPGGTRAVVGRSAEEHEYLLRYARYNDLILKPADSDNPILLCRDVSWNNDILLAAGILVSLTLDSEIDVAIRIPVESESMHVLHGIRPIDPTLLEKWKIDSVANE